MNGYICRTYLRKLERVSKKIDNKKYLLDYYISNNEDFQRILLISQELDILINRYYKLKNIVEKLCA